MFFTNEPRCKKENKIFHIFQSLYVFDVKPLIKYNMKKDNMNFMQKYTLYQH